MMALNEVLWTVLKAFLSNVIISFIFVIVIQCVYNLLIFPENVSSTLSFFASSITGGLPPMII